MRLGIMLAVALVLAGPAAAADHADWRQPQAPFRLYGDSYYVGTRGLAAILLASPQGLVLIDGTLPENAPLIEANIRALGFHVRDIRLILNSHAHADHAGAIAALVRDSGAAVRASPAAVRALELGGRDPADPQYGDAPEFPPVAKVGPLRDGETVRVGPLALTAHFTPGHTPGSTSWTWRSCERGRCLNLVYADSLSALAAPGYRFGDEARHPGYVQAFRRSFERVAALPCDILITPHPEASDFMDRADRRRRDPEALRDPGACRRYADTARAALQATLDAERGTAR